MIQAIEHAESALIVQCWSRFFKNPREKPVKSKRHLKIFSIGELIDITDVVISWVQADKENHDLEGNVADRYPRYLKTRKAAINAFHQITQIT